MVAGGDIDKDLILDEGRYPVIANALTNDGIVGYYNEDYRIKAPAVTITGRGDVGHAKARIVDFTPVVRLLSLKSNHDVFFLENAINTLKIVIESTGVPQLTVPQLAKYEISFPKSLDEEEKIGAYFKQLDNLITLHQRECISFTGRADRLILTANKKRTTSSWEQRKLGNVATEMVAGGDIDKDLILDEGRYPVIANALTNDGIVGYYNEDYRIKAPAVTITGRGDVGHAKARIVDFTPVVRLLSLKSNHDVFFLENAINTLKIVIESTGVPQLTVPQLAKYEISFPKSLDEEEKIGAYFKQLDNLITLHQRKGKAAVSGCFLNCSSLEKSSAQSRTLELFGQTSNQEIKYIIDGLSILGGKLRNFCVKLIILLSYTRINDIAKYHISRNTECVHNIN